MAVDNDEWVVTIKAGASIVDARPVFSGDSKYLMVVCGDKIKVLSIASGSCLHDLRGHTNKVTCICLCPANKFQLLSVSIDKTLVKWDYQDGVALRTYSFAYELRSVYSVSPADSTMLVTVQNDSGAGKPVFELVAFEMPSGEHADIVKTKTIFTPLDLWQTRVAVGCEGLFVACITKKMKAIEVYVFSTGETLKHNIESRHRERLWCLTCHPTEQCIATGCASGQILLWWNFLQPGASVSKAIHHWHHLPINDLVYSPEGSCLLSGGADSVLLKWRHERNLHDNLPLLPAQIKFIACSPDGTVYATCHKDNSVLIINNGLTVIKSFQSLTRYYGDLKVVTFDPRTTSVVCQGVPGHIQFFSVEKDTQLYNLDIVCQNYIQRPNVDQIKVVTEVDCVAFDAAGDWLATVERRDDGETAVEVRLKFWKYNTGTSQYVLNTVVNSPHSGRVNALRFSPTPGGARPTPGSASPVAVTTGDDAKFKVWSLVDDSNIYRENEAWSCLSVGYYRHLAANCADFSADGSLLAVGFTGTVTLWAVGSHTLRETRPPLGGDDTDIRLLGFGGNSHQELLVSATKARLTVYNLVTDTVHWSRALDVAEVAYNRLDGSIAVFQSTMKMVFFHLTTPQPVDTVACDCAVKNMLFIPHSRKSSVSCPSGWQDSATLYFFNQKKEMFSFEKAKTEGDVSALPTSHPAIVSSSERSLPPTPFSLLIGGVGTRSGITPRVGSGLTPEGQLAPGCLRDTHFVKEMLATPAHVLPPMGTLCSGFLEKMLLPMKSSSKHDASDDDEDSDGDAASSSSEMEVDKDEEKSVATETVEPKVVPRKGEAYSDVMLDTFSWMTSL